MKKTELYIPTIMKPCCRTASLGFERELLLRLSRRCSSFSRWASSSKISLNSSVDRWASSATWRRAEMSSGKTGVENLSGWKHVMIYHNTTTLGKDLNASHNWFV